MNNEIKEILDRLFVYKNENDEMKYQPEDILTIDDVWLILDYITNLQEENEELKANLEMYENGVYFSSENDKLQERIDKAREYIECGKTFDDIEVARIIDKYEKILLEILKGK